MRSLRRRAWSGWLAGGVLLAALGVGAVSPAAGQALSAAAQRGRRLYLAGEGGDGQAVTALLGTAGTEVPATALPCASCHGKDGKGRPEGGVAPSNITWGALTKPYGVRHPSGREHPPYDARSLVRAVTLGVDAGGNALSPLMPRYRLSREQAADLVAYLQAITGDRDPGIAEEALRLGLWLPPEGAAAELLERTARHWSDGVNARGGLFARRLEWVVGRAPAPVGERAAALGCFLDQEAPFALLAPALTGDEEASAEAIEARGVPAVGVLAAEPPARRAADRYLFYVFPGRCEQARAVVAAQGDAARDHLGILAREGEGLDALVPALAAELGASAVARFSPGAGSLSAALGTLAAQEVESVLFLGPPDSLPAVLAGLAAWPRQPRLLLAGGRLAGAALGRPSAFRGELWITVPTLPSDVAPAAKAELEAASGSTSGAGLAPLLATRLLQIGLEQAGRELSREGLVTAIEGLYELPTDLTRPLSFGPNQRLGLAGAYVARLDPASGELATPPRWVKVE